MQKELFSQAALTFLGIIAMMFLILIPKRRRPRERNSEAEKKTKTRAVCFLWSGLLCKDDISLRS